ncbi:hypothetical protein EV424DRAFT_774410 [Suillus variegatus]|nr:hypothetical protein EV424DRAFT_774410 [Suillus variegatus]
MNGILGRYWQNLHQNLHQNLPVNLCPTRYQNLPKPPPLLLPVGRRKYTGPGLLPQVKLADPDAHPIRAVSTRQDRNDHLSPMAPRHPSKFATHPPQQANQVLSYPPAASQPHFTQTQISPPPSKPGSSSSSSSNHTDATRFTNSSSSAFTSTSSIAPAIKHLDVTRPQGRSQSTSVQPQRLAANLIKPVSPPSRSLGTSLADANVPAAISTVRTTSKTLTQTRPLSAVPPSCTFPRAARQKFATKLNANYDYDCYDTDCHSII